MQDEIEKIAQGLTRIRKSFKTTAHIQEVYELLQETGQLMDLPWVSAFRNILDLESQQTLDSARMSGLPDDLFHEARKRHYGFKSDSRVRTGRLPFVLSANRFSSSKLRDDSDHRAMAKLQAEFGITTTLIVPLHHPTGMVGNIFWAGGLNISIAERLVHEATAELLAFSYEFADIVEDSLGESNFSENVPYLTKRERECLMHIANGYHVPEIATMINISQTTIRYHLDNCREKLGAASTAHAVALASQLGLLRNITPRPKI